MVDVWVIGSLKIKLCSFMGVMGLQLMAQSGVDLPGHADNGPTLLFLDGPCES